MKKIHIFCIFKDKIFELNEINPAKCTEYDYINFLIASSRVFSCTEASKCSFIDSTSPAHDSITRLLGRQPPDTEAFWDEVKNLVTPEIGLLVIDDTTLDKPYSKHMDLVYRQWSGKHHQIQYFTKISPPFLPHPLPQTLYCNSNL